VVALRQTPGSGLHLPIQRLLLLAAREIRLLASLTPVDAHHERRRLAGELASGRSASPRWVYAPVECDDLRRALDTAERALAPEVATAIDRLYLERIRELSLEAELCCSAGTPRIARLARERFAPVDTSVTELASGLCARWLAEAPVEPPEETRMSDDADPRSLLSRMRAEVGRRRLPFTVVAQPTLAPLAATGDGVILVAPGRPVSDEDATRTVLHEVEGHACPRARAETAGMVLLRIGTARGVDDQEGRALLLEERAGLMGPRRRRQLATRHRAFEAMLEGGTFAEVTRHLVREHGLAPDAAILVAERVFRGGDGIRPGLGRERVYLEAMVRVRAHLQSWPGDEALLASGQVAVHAASALREVELT
jgi:hypothetical protein